MRSSPCCARPVLPPARNLARSARRTGSGIPHDDSSRSHHGPATAFAARRWPADGLLRRARQARRRRPARETAGTPSRGQSTRFAGTRSARWLKISSAAIGCSGRRRNTPNERRRPHRPVPPVAGMTLEVPERGNQDGMKPANGAGFSFAPPVALAQTPGRHAQTQVDPAAARRAWETVSTERSRPGLAKNAHAKTAGQNGCQRRGPGDSGRGSGRIGRRPGIAVGQRYPLAADRLAGDGCLRQGWHDQTRHVGGQSARCRGRSLQKTDRRRSQPQLSLALCPLGSGAGTNRHLQPLLLRRRAGTAGPSRAAAAAWSPTASRASRSGRVATTTSTASSSTSRGAAR